MHLRVTSYNVVSYKASCEDVRRPMPKQGRSEFLEAIIDDADDFRHGCRRNNIIEDIVVFLLEHRRKGMRSPLDLLS